MKIGDYVQILDGSENWHGLYGSIEEIVDGIPVVFCICRPFEKYYIFPELMDKVKIFES